MEDDTKKQPFRIHSDGQGNNYVNFEAGTISIPLTVLKNIANACGISLDRCRRFMMAYIKDSFKDTVDSFHNDLTVLEIDKIVKYFETLNKSAGTVRQLTSEEKEIKELREKIKELKNKVKEKKNESTKE